MCRQRSSGGRTTTLATFRMRSTAPSGCTSSVLSLLTTSVCRCPTVFALPWAHRDRLTPKPTSQRSSCALVSNVSAVTLRGGGASATATGGSMAILCRSVFHRIEGRRCVLAPSAANAMDGRRRETSGAPSVAEVSGTHMRRP
eukprot:1597144-Prymnesium_polylepis.1